MLGYGGPWLTPNPPNAPHGSTYYPRSLANALAGRDLSDENPEIFNTFNSKYPWYFGTDGKPTAGKVDFVTVALHETAHGLGFSGSMKRDDGKPDKEDNNECNGVEGWFCWGWDTPASPAIYDRFTQDSDGRSLIDTRVYANPSEELGDVLRSGNVYFNGANANRGNGGERVKLYAPKDWSDGSSYSHLDRATYFNTPNALMIYNVPSATAIHDPGPVTLGILLDMGWGLAELSQVTGISVDLVRNGNGNSSNPVISADGRYVAFESAANNLVDNLGNDNNNETDIYLYDRATQELTRVSQVDNFEYPMYWGARGASISGDGRYVAFHRAEEPGIGSVLSIIVHDRLTGTYTEVDAVPFDPITEYPQRLSDPAVSADGRYVAYLYMISGSDQDLSYIRVRPIQGGKGWSICMESCGSNRIKDKPTISADGNLVAFRATDGLDATGDIYVYDHGTGEIDPVTVGTDGKSGNGDSSNPSISADGRYVAFQSAASNLVANDANGAIDIFVHDRLTRETTRLASGSAGEWEANGDSSTPSISADGRYVAFQSAASNLVANDANGVIDIFVHDRLTHETTRLASGSAGEWEADGDSSNPSISGDGQHTAFSSNAANLVYGDTNGFTDVFSQSIDPCAPVPGNLIVNSCFADGKTSWKFYTDGRGGFSVSSDGITSLTAGAGPTESDSFARIRINESGKNVQLFQKGIILQPNTAYKLSFVAYSSNGRNMSVWLHQHTEPYTNYGLANHTIQLEKGWQLYTISFTTPDLMDMNNGRLRFWLGPFDTAGTVYYIDRVVLSPINP